MTSAALAVSPIAVLIYMLAVLLSLPLGSDGQIRVPLLRHKFASPRFGKVIGEYFIALSVGTPEQHVVALPDTENGVRNAN